MLQKKNHLIDSLNTAIVPDIKREMLLPWSKATFRNVLLYCLRATNLWATMPGALHSKKVSSKTSRYCYLKNSLVSTTTTLYYQLFASWPPSIRADCVIKQKRNEDTKEGTKNLKLQLFEPIAIYWSGSFYVFRNRQGLDFVHERIKTAWLKMSRKTLIWRELNWKCSTQLLLAPFGQK